jgi:DNA-binding CsgD family transcriptional regulator
MVEKPALVGREQELDELARFLDAVPAGPVGLLLEGDAGIGKTTLWREAVWAALDRSYRVLSCRPVGSEAQFAFAGLGDLLEEVSEETMAGLPAPQRRALDVALLRAEAEGPAALPRAVSLSVLGVLRALAQVSPVVVAVDDVQWLDRPSAVALEFVVRRLKEEPIGLLVSKRGEATDDFPLGFDRAFPESRVDRLLVGPLDLDALDRVLRARLDAQFPRPALAQLHASSGGNPFFALEMARAVLQREPQLGRGEPLPVPDSLRVLVSERLARLAPATREVAFVVSGLSRATVELVQAAAGGRRPAAGLAKAVDAGVLEVDGGRVRFAHPLVASVVYADATAAQRRELHAHIAMVIDDPEERARHLALAAETPDAEVATALDQAARRARARGAPTDAADLYEEARRLTPGEEAEEASRRGIDGAECHFEAGETGRARALLEELASTTPPGPDRVRALTFLAWVRTYQEGYTLAPETFRTALKEAGADLAQRIELERGLAFSLHEIGDLRNADIHARAALEMAERLREPSVLARALADMAFHEAVAGHGAPLARIESALPLDRPTEWQPILGHPRWIHALLLQWSGELDGSLATLKQLHRDAAERGDEHSLPYLLFHLARVETLRGNLEVAGRYAEEAYQAATESGQESERPFSLTVKALVAAHLGRVEAARAATDEGMPLALRMGVIVAYLELRAVRGFLELSLGKFADAHRFLAPVTEDVAKAGFGEPALFRFHGDAIEALVALGELEQAERLVDELEEQGRRLQRTWALVTASRCRGLLRAAQGDMPGAHSALEGALDLHERLREPFELGRTYLVLGTVQRRSRKKRPARESLQRALEIFDELGTRLWSDRARAELARIGGRAPSEIDLTPTERRVAELIAAGGTYREVADALFISPKTVQWNLSKIYRKLGIRSRAQLAASLAAGRGGGSTPAGPPVPP